MTPTLDDVSVSPEWLLVRECEAPFGTKSAGGIDISNVLEGSGLRWDRVVKSGSSRYGTGDLVCVRQGAWDKVYGPGGMVYGLVAASHVNLRIPAERCKDVRDCVVTAEVDEQRGRDEFEKFKHKVAAAQLTNAMRPQAIRAV